MSTRRIDDPGSFDGDAIGALVAQLPGATRLSHVLTAGAKHLEAQQLQQRKSADVAGYARSNFPSTRSGHYSPFQYVSGPFSIGVRDLRWLVPQFFAAMGKLKAAGRRNEMASMGVKSRIDQIIEACVQAADLDYLREKDAYAVLGFMANPNNEADYWKQRLARQLLREALHNDRAPPPTDPNQETERAKVVRLVKEARKWLEDGTDVSNVDPAKPLWQQPLPMNELEEIDREIRGDPLPQSDAQLAAAGADERAHNIQDRQRQRNNMGAVNRVMNAQRDAEEARGVRGEVNPGAKDADGEDPESQRQWNY